MEKLVLWQKFLFDGPFAIVWVWAVLDYTFSMGAIKTILENHLPGVHVHSLMIGKSPNEDTLNGFFMSVNHQMEIACDLIKNDPLLQDG